DLGYQALKDKTEAFGFNPKSDLKIPLPVQKSYFPSSDPGIASTMMSAIGQYEVRTSPLMMATVAAAVANQGTQMRPF
ncbi:Cell elongation-specific peptidoglycan D,D-transpeptidase, partial [human gut metagenome]